MDYLFYICTINNNKTNIMKAIFLISLAISLILLVISFVIISFELMAIAEICFLSIVMFQKLYKFDINFNKKD